MERKKIHNIIANEINRYIFENINNSTNTFIVYRGGSELAHEHFSDVIWFSDKPIQYFTHGGRDKMSRYLIQLNNPLIVNVNDEWCGKLWWYYLDDNGEIIRQSNDPKLTSIMPSQIWDYVMESEEEYEFGDIPYIVKNMVNSGLVNYDSVILKNIGETPVADVYCTDYVVFSMDNIIKKLK